jgi:hypothetical protein
MAGSRRRSRGAKKKAAANSNEKLPSSEPPSSHIPRDSTPDIVSGDGTPTHSTEEDIDSSSHDHQCQDAAESTPSLMHDNFSERDTLHLLPDFGSADPYKVLGVSFKATLQEIKTSFRKLARMHHPDMHKTQTDKDDAKANFVRINNAYDLLKDDESRQLPR